MVDPLRQRDHLLDLPAGLAGAEVRADPLSEVARSSYVEHLVGRSAEQVDAGRAGQVVGQRALATPRRRHVTGQLLQLGQALHAERSQPLEQGVQHVDGGPGVGQRPVVGCDRRPQQRREQSQPDARCFLPGEYPARQPDSVHHRVARPGQAEPGAGGLEKADVEARVVRDQHRPADEFQERGQHGRDGGCVVDHGIGDPGEHDDLRRNRPARVDQSGELAEYFTASDLDRPELGDRLGGRRPSGGFQIHHDERDITERITQLVEAVLMLDGGARGADGAAGAHETHVRAEHRQRHGGPA